jgi:hypothetical protein
MNDIIYLHDKTDQFSFIGYDHTQIIHFGENNILLNSCPYVSEHMDLLLDYDGNEIERICLDKINWYDDDIGLSYMYSNSDSPNFIKSNYECKFNNSLELKVIDMHYKRGIDLLNQRYYNLHEFSILKKYANKCEDDDIRLEICTEFNDYLISIWSFDIYAVIYIISNKYSNKIISVFIDPNLIFQIADCNTNIYLLNNKNLLIWNQGDVYSVINISLKGG